MLIGLLEQFADAEEVAGSAAVAAQLRGEAAALRGHMEARLWARSDDHCTWGWASVCLGRLLRHESSDWRLRRGRLVLDG